MPTNPTVRSAQPRSTAAKVWMAAMIVLLAAAAAPLVVNTIQRSREWLAAGPEYAADIPGTVLLTLAFLLPFVLLGLQAVWSAKRTRGIPVVTAACLIVAAAAAYGYWVIATDESSTAALVFIVVIPVSWGVALIAGVILLIINSTRRALARDQAPH